jgi:hypothetical protein
MIGSDQGFATPTRSVMMPILIVSCAPAGIAVANAAAATAATAAIANRALCMAPPL